MTAPATAATTTEAAAATTTGARLLRAGFIDDQITAAEILPVHGIDRAIGFFVIGNFDEGETARLAREPITNEVDCRGINTSLREKIVQGIFRCGKWKITNVKLLHLRTPSARNRTACRGARWNAGTILCGQSGEPKPPFLSPAGENQGRGPKCLGGTESGAPAVSCILSEIDRFCNEKLRSEAGKELYGRGQIRCIENSDRMRALCKNSRVDSLCAGP